MNAVLDIAGLAKGFDGVPALDGVSFAVREGEMVGIVGPNGAGKSTLLDCALGAMRPDAGTVRFDGRDVQAMRPGEPARRGAGRSFAAPRTLPGLSVRDCLVLAGQAPRGMLGRLRGRADAALAAAADRLIAHFRIEHLADLPADALTVGEQKLAELAMAFMAGTRLVALDEPTVGLNPALAADLGKRLRALNAERGTAVVIAEHDIAFAAAVCTRLIVLAEGRVIADGPPAATRHDARVVEAYLGA